MRNKDNLKKTLMGSNSETKKGGAIIFLYATRSLYFIHIAITFHQDILYGYLGMARIRIV